MSDLPVSKLRKTALQIRFWTLGYIATIVVSLSSSLFLSSRSSSPGEFSTQAWTISLAVIFLLAVVLLSFPLWRYVQWTNQVSRNQHPDLMVSGVRLKKWITAGTYANVVYGIVTLIGFVVALFKFKLGLISVVTNLETATLLIYIYFWLLVLRLAPDWIENIHANQIYPRSLEFQTYFKGLIGATLLMTLLNVTVMFLKAAVESVVYVNAVISLSSSVIFIVLLILSIRFVRHAPLSTPTLSTS